MKLIQNSKFKIQSSRQGFSLIELMVAMFIFVLLMGAMVAVSVAGFRSYGKSKAIKIVTEDVGFALNSITKDVRMGKIESAAGCIGAGPSPNKCLMVTRNATQEKVCYIITTNGTGSDFLAVGNITDATCPAPSDTRYKKIVDLTGTGMNFSSNSGFYSMITSGNAVPIPNKIRGWAEINFNIDSPGMETDSISVQTIVSSRDYGWEAL